MTKLQIRTELSACVSDLEQTIFVINRPQVATGVGMINAVSATLRKIVESLDEESEMLTKKKEARTKKDK